MCQIGGNNSEKLCGRYCKWNTHNFSSSAKLRLYAYSHSFAEVLKLAESKKFLTKIRRNKPIADKQEELFKKYNSKTFYEIGNKLSPNKGRGLEKVKN